MPAKLTAAEKRARLKIQRENIRAKKKAKQDAAKTKKIAAAQKVRDKKAAAAERARAKKAALPRKASPSSIAARDAYIERRPMRGYYLDIDQIEYLEEVRRSDPGSKVPSASEVVRSILREYMEHHPIVERPKGPARKKK